MIIAVDVIGTVAVLAVVLVEDVLTSPAAEVLSVERVPSVGAAIPAVLTIPELVELFACDIILVEMAVNHPSVCTDASRKKPDRRLLMSPLCLWCPRMVSCLLARLRRSYRMSWCHKSLKLVEGITMGDVAENNLSVALTPENFGGLPHG